MSCAALVCVATLTVRTEVFVGRRLQSLPRSVLGPVLVPILPGCVDETIRSLGTHVRAMPDDVRSARPRRVRNRSGENPKHLDRVG